MVILWSICSSSYHKGGRTGKKILYSEKNIFVWKWSLNFLATLSSTTIVWSVFQRKKKPNELPLAGVVCLRSGVRFLLNNWRQDGCLVLYVLLPKLLWMKTIPKPLQAVPSPEKYVFSFTRRKKCFLLYDWENICC